jgi:predicted ATPase
MLLDELQQALPRFHMYQEELPMMETWRNVSEVQLPCYMIPYGLNLRFFGRKEESTLLQEQLDPTADGKEMRVVAVHGLGGVGKTQLALHYANTWMRSFDAIAWIPAETQIKLVQALSRFAAKLGLQSHEGNEDDYQSVKKVRDWLNTTDKNFLLVFDNVTDGKILDQIWPATEKASILITTRSPAVAAYKAIKLLNLQKFDLETGENVLRLLTGTNPVTDEEKDASMEICRQVDGLALTLQQISSFIRNRGFTYQEFVALYKKAAEKILSRSEIPADYSYTSLTTWDISLEQLSPEAKVLLNLLAFFDPDLIPERLIVDTKAKLNEPSLEFLFDEFEWVPSLPII